MPLSFSKLESLLHENGLYIRVVYTVSGQIVHVELYSNQTAQSFLMYVPSKYEVPVPPGLNNAFEVRYVEEKEFLVVDPEEDTGTEVANVETYLLPDNVEKSLISGYTSEAVSTGIVHEDSRDMRNIFGQMQRLKLCVRGLKFKVALQLRNALCVVRRDDTLDCFYMSGMRGDRDKKLFVVTDLEVFFADPPGVVRSVQGVRNGLYKVLQGNQLRNARAVDALMGSKLNVQKVAEELFKLRSRYTRCVRRLETMLERLSRVESNVLGVLDELRVRPRGAAHVEMNRGQEIYKAEKQLEGVSALKKDVARELHMVRSREESISLEIDVVMYDNAVMFERISRNFSRLLSMK